MSFGWSASDVAALTQVAWRVVQNARKACGEYEELTREAFGLHIVLRRLEKEIAKPESLLNKPGDTCGGELETIASDCRRVLGILDKVLEKYGALSEKERSLRKLWQRVRLGNGEMMNLNNLREKVTYYTSVLGLYLNMVSVGSMGRVEKQMEEAGGDLKEVKSAVNTVTAHLLAKSTREGSTLTSYTSDDKSVWKEFRRTLVKQGFSSSFLHKHKATIQAYFEELGSRGILDEPDLSDEEGPSRSDISLRGSSQSSHAPQSREEADVQDQVPNVEEKHKQVLRVTATAIQEEIPEEAALPLVPARPSNESSDVDKQIEGEEETEGEEEAAVEEGNDAKEEHVAETHVDENSDAAQENNGHARIDPGDESMNEEYHRWFKFTEVSRRPSTDSQTDPGRKLHPLSSHEYDIQALSIVFYGYQAHTQVPWERIERENWFKFHKRLVPSYSRLFIASSWGVFLFDVYIGPNICLLDYEYRTRLPNATRSSEAVGKALLVLSRFVDHMDTLSRWPELARRSSYTSVASMDRGWDLWRDWIRLVRDCSRCSSNAEVWAHEVYSVAHKSHVLISKIVVWVNAFEDVYWCV